MNKGAHVGVQIKTPVVMEVKCQQLSIIKANLQTYPTTFNHSKTTHKINGSVQKHYFLLFKYEAGPNQTRSIMKIDLVWFTSTQFYFDQI